MKYHLEQLNVPAAIVERTLNSLRDAGSRNSEGVVLWLGRRTSGVDIVEAYIPHYESERDFFWIPRDSMAALLRHLGQTQTFLAAQVHSHPGLAFHSEADDRWAIVRHVGALSLVVPRFAASTTPKTFLTDIAAFSLSSRNQWTELDKADTERLVKMV